jgi:putative methyltransferase (TIGR04325 family)
LLIQMLAANVRRALEKNPRIGLAKRLLRRLATQVVPAPKAAHEVNFTGDYETWEAALSDSHGYDDVAILARVRESTRRVLTEPGLHERDGVVFGEPQWNFPLLACLLRTASMHGNSLRVLDFGGSLGSTYHQVRPFLRGLDALQWSIVEQPHFVECGRLEFQTERLRFYASIAETLQEGPVDVALISGVLSYLPNPYVVLEQLAGSSTRSLIVDRTPVIEGGRDRITVQHVPADIYGVAIRYPALVFARDNLYPWLSAHWNIQVDTQGTDGSTWVDGQRATFRTVLLER